MPLLKKSHGSTSSQLENPPTKKIRRKKEFLIPPKFVMEYKHKAETAF